MSKIIQVVNAELNMQRKSRSLLDKDYDRWRVKQISKLAEVKEQLEVVKVILHRFATDDNEEKRKACLISPVGKELVQSSKKAVGELWDYIRALETTIEQLKLENDVLKQNINELTTNAPGEGWDEWRDRPTTVETLR